MSNTTARLGPIPSSDNGFVWRAPDRTQYLRTNIVHTVHIVHVAYVMTTEYDPLEPNRRAIKARVGRLRDPCSRVLDKRVEENSLLLEEGEHCTRRDGYCRIGVATYSVVQKKKQSLSPRQRVDEVGRVDSLQSAVPALVVSGMHQQDWHVL